MRGESRRPREKDGKRVAPPRKMDSDKQGGFMLNCTWVEKKGQVQMSKKLFSRGQMEDLRSNPNVQSVTQRVLTFTPAFKQKAYDALYQGKPITQIFEEAGFDVEMLGKKRLENFRARLEKEAEREEGFADLRTNNSRQESRSSEAMQKARIKQLEHRIAYLEQENDFLKKIQEAAKAEAKKCRRK